MKKRDFTLKGLALTGLVAGLLVAPAHAAEEAKNKPAAADKPKKATTEDKQKKTDSDDDFMKAFDKYDGNIGYHLFTDEEMKRELNPDGLRMYESLSPEGKELARKVASQSCNGQNDCKGLGGCQTDEHKCAGKNKCKGKGKCAIADKNLAVKLAFDKMRDKREGAQNGQ